MVILMFGTQLAVINIEPVAQPKTPDERVLANQSAEKWHGTFKCVRAQWPTMKPKE